MNEYLHLHNSLLSVWPQHNFLLMHMYAAWCIKVIQQVHVWLCAVHNFKTKLKQSLYNFFIQIEQSNQSRYRLKYVFGMYRKMFCEDMCTRYEKYCMMDTRRLIKPQVSRSTKHSHKTIYMHILFSKFCAFCVFWSNMHTDISLFHSSYPCKLPDLMSPLGYYDVWLLIHKSVFWKYL